MIVRATKVADAVLAIVDTLVQQETILHAYPYKNCRENGWTLKSDTKTIRVAENRNSDDIVVYLEPDQYRYTDSVSDEAYNNRKLFKYNEYLEAARFIVTALGVLSIEV